MDNFRRKIFAMEEARLTLSNDQYTCNANSNYTTITVYYDGIALKKGFTVKKKNYSNFSDTPTVQATSNGVYIKVPINYSTSSRSFTVVVSYGSDTTELTVSQGANSAGSTRHIYAVLSISGVRTSMSSRLGGALCASDATANGSYYLTTTCSANVAFYECVEWQYGTEFKSVTSKGSGTATAENISQFTYQAKGSEVLTGSIYVSTYFDPVTYGGETYSRAGGGYSNSIKYSPGYQTSNAWNSSNAVSSGTGVSGTIYFSKDTISESGVSSSKKSKSVTVRVSSGPSVSISA